ncbi:hypothetical protein ACSTI1_00580, partial [Vibrio parahaemolyticus]
ALSDEEIAEKRAALEQVTDSPVMVLSGATGKGVEAVLFALLAQIKAGREAQAEAEARPSAVAGWRPGNAITHQPDDDDGDPDDGELDESDDFAAI